MLKSNCNAENYDGRIGEFLYYVPALPELIIISVFLEISNTSVADKLLMFPQEIEQ